MSGSLNQMPNYRANLPKEGHNIGMKYYFTSSCGMILPVYHHFLNQGEKVYFNANVNTNVAIPLVKPAQLSVRQKIDVFFIPMQMLLTDFGQRFYGGNDLLTSLNSTEQVSDQLPVFNFSENFISLFDNLASLNRASGLDLFSAQGQIPSMDTKGFDSIGKSAYRLLMHLNYNPQSVFSKFVDDESYESEINEYQPNVFPAALLAYHAIYENYYRNDDRERRRLQTYQFDFYNGSALENLVARGLFSLHYHSRIKDYFTSLKVSPILSTLNLSGGFTESTGEGNELSSVLNFLNNSEIDGNTSPYLADANAFSRLYNSDLFADKLITQFASNSSVLSTGAIRSLFAVEKLNRILGRAKKDYDSQTLAHLGFKVPRDVKHEITYLGGYDGGIGVQQRFSQANTYNSATGDGAELGEQFGTAEGGIRGDHTIEFEAPCHGVFMAVMYTVPETSYPQGVCLDKMNMLTERLSFYQPEFDKLGMQPLYAYEAVNRKIPFGTDGRPFNTRIREGVILGWQYRYEQYKRKFNRHSIAFFRPRAYYGNDGDIPVNTWSPWIVSSEAYEWFYGTGNAGILSDAIPCCYSFWVSPTFLDDLFVNTYNTHIGLVPDMVQSRDYTVDEQSSIYDYMNHPWLMFQTDMFMHAATFNVKLVSTMSTYGEPELD